MSLTFRSRPLVIAALAAATILATAQSAFAAAGDLDGTFDGDGRALYDRGDNEQGTAVAQGPGGKLFVAVETATGIGVLRVKPNGDPDTDYGDAGSALFDVGDDQGAEGVALLPDGSAFVAGTFSVGDNRRGFVVKFTPEGDPDTGFSGDGKFVLANGSDDVYMDDVAVQPDGKVVITGESDPTDTRSLFLTARIKTNGVLDPTFGGDGRVVTGFGQGFDGAWRIVRQADGKLVVGGWTEESVDSSEYDPAFARYLANGNLDATFGNHGRAVIPLFDGGDDYVNGMVLAPGGKIAACLNARTAASIDFVALMRLTPKGKPDLTFGGDGATILGTLGDASCRDIAAQDDGKLVVSASEVPGVPLAAIRVTSGGRIDKGFGEDGVADADFGTPFAGIDGIAVQANGRIVVVGGVTNGSNSDVAVARFLP